MKATLFYKSIVVGIILIGSIINVHAQYIKLRGKQFVNQNDSVFYPVICNYELRLACNICNCGNGGSNCDSSDYELHPTYEYGSNLSFEHPFRNGIDKIKADFIKMKQMGFNTVRIMTMQNFINAHWIFDTTVKAVVPNENGSRVVCIKYGDAYNDGKGWWGHWLMVDTPYSTNSNFQKIYLPKIKQLLDTASSVGINVIFVVGRGYVSACANVPEVKDQAQADYYKNYLVALAKNLKTKNNLLAYDLYNEPEFTGEWNPPDSWGRFATKQKYKICKFVAMWYDSMKTADPNHLITIGNGNTSGIFNYDPAIMKLDFNSHHDYAYWYWKSYNNYDKTIAINAMNSVLHWYNRVNPHPWILGETAATAWTAKGQDVYAQHGDAYNYSYTAYPNFVGVNLSKPPYGNVWGNYDDQDTFARWSQQTVLNNSGSGYAWWMFQDLNLHFPLQDTLPPLDVSFGLLKPGNPSGSAPNYTYTTSIDKPVVANAFSGNTPTKATTQAALPFNYYNPFQGQYYTYSGTVKDQNGQPIKDALILGSNNWHHSKPKKFWWQNSSDLYKMPYKDAFEVFTFSREDGTFDLKAPLVRPADSAKTPTNNGYWYDYGKFDAIFVSAPGASTYGWADESTTPREQSDKLATLPATIVLHRTADSYDRLVQNTIVLMNSNKTYTARHELTAKAVGIDSLGVADLHATNRVKLQASFIAKRGSRLKAYIAPVACNCEALKDNNGNAFKKGEGDADTVVPNPQAIALHYQLKAPAMALYPNPCDTKATLAIGEPGQCELEIADANGKTVYSTAFYNSGKAEITTSGYASGIYTAKVSLGSRQETIKFIVQHPK